MARVVVVGGGFGGLAAAVRLAKLGHEVTLAERSERLGGALTRVEQDGFSWDAGPTATLVPAVVRDLFRKSGRPLERELELVPQDIIREHRFEDDTRVRIPGGSRARQLRAVDELGEGLGRQWVDWVASYADTWDVLRRHYLERPWRPELADKDVTALVLTRESLARRIRRQLRDGRLRQVAAHAVTLDGHEPRNVPAWLGVTTYLEQSFGSWTVPGGMAALTDALTARLGTRGVSVLTGTEVTDVVVRGGRAVAVATTAGEVDADVVVCAVDPRRLPVLAEHVRRTMPVIPPVITHLGLEGEVPDLAPETVLHGNPTLVLRTGGTAPGGGHAWTVLARGLVAEDLTDALARHRVDVRRQLVTRVDLTPRQLVEQWGGSPLGVWWEGRSTVRRRLGPTTPVPGVYACGAHATPGSGLPFVGLSAALVAQEVGAAER
jgi:UDP-galactopyranose mutase